MVVSDALDSVFVLQVLTADGSPEREVGIDSIPLEIGRAAAGIGCPNDADLEDIHARVSFEAGAVIVSDLGKGSGVWLRISGSEGRALCSGDQLWLGHQILILRKTGSGWQARHHGPDGNRRGVHAIGRDDVFIGRGSELVLDADDTGLSRRHAQLVPEGEGLRLFDRGAHNGTYLRLTQAETLCVGDEFRVGTTRIRLAKRGLPASSGDARVLNIISEMDEIGVPDTKADAAFDLEPNRHPATQIETSRPSRGLGERLREIGRRVGEEGASLPPPLDESVADVSASGNFIVVIDSEAGSVSLEVTPGQTILEAVQAADLVRGEPVDWECGDGGCGVCVLGIVDGADRLDPPDPSSGEMRTIQITEHVIPDPKKYRLACLARVRGTVRLRKLN